MALSDDDVTSRKRKPGSEPPSERRLSFVTPRGALSVALPSVGELVIGRSTQADIRVEDESISRRHARITVGDECSLEDLGSSNGTRLHERDLSPGERVSLHRGAVFFLGDVLCLVQGGPEGPLRRVLPIESLRQRVDAHCADADARSGLTLLHLRVRGVTPAVLEGALLRALGPSDQIALMKPDEALVAMMGRDATDAEGISSLLRSQVAAPGRRVSIGVATYPQHGRNAAALTAHAASVLERLTQVDTGPDVLVLAPAMQKLHGLLDRVAQGTINVLLLGETGAGKEVFASRLHAASPRAERPFVRFNCAALSDSLVEAELFGHEKGAFTGAVGARPGLIEAAHGGTVFLDEVGELSLPVQAKLLRVLEDRKVRRVGATQERPVDVRFVAATNRDLEVESAQGRFRQDLYFRLNGVSLKIPPLRERPEEIEPLAERFLTKAAAAAGLATCPTLSAPARAALLQHRWPGNIRELRNVLERAALLCDGGSIEVADLAMEPSSSTASVPPPASVPPQGIGESPPSADDLSPSEVKERQRIVESLERVLWNQSEAARQLGISRKVLMNRMDRYRIPRPHKGRD